MTLQATAEKSMDIRKIYHALEKEIHGKEWTVSVKFSSVIHLTVDNYYLRGFGLISISV